MTISENGAESHHPRKAYVEDAPESEEKPKKSITIVEPEPETPAAPKPNPSQAQPPVSVFDFLVPGDTPNASKASLIDTKPSAKMDSYSPSVNASAFSLEPNGATTKHDPEYEKRGYSYGSEPIPVTQRRDRPQVEYFTPAPKDFLKDLEAAHRESKANGKSTDKKRKRHVEDLDLTVARCASQDSDLVMSDAPPAGFHTGLTGGLNRLLSHESDHDERRKDDPPSPIKRSKPSATYYVKERSRSKAGSSVAGSSALVKVKKRRSSDEDRPRKHHRATSDQQSQSQRQDRPDEASQRTRHSHHRSRSTSRATSRANTSVKAIEYHPHSDYETDNGDDRRQLILYKTRAELFMNFVTKGPESEGGCSVNKALKRYHRERAAISGRGFGEYRSSEKEGEEKELWKGLRLKRNERGEVVVFF